ncbi:MAG: hypothetical protein KGL58_08930, partial [Pseudomonadota bacterium]|nr:hypothetical protein [Pseudomonadota bacterium]
ESGQEEEVLAGIWKDLGLRNFDTTVMLRFSEYQLLLMDAPDVPESEMAQAVRWKIKDMVDYPPAEATVDVIRLPLSGQRTRQVYAVCARNTIVAYYMKSCLKAGVNLKAVDIPEMAINELIPAQDGNVVVLAFDEAAGYLVFISRGLVFHVRHLDIILSKLESVSKERLVLEVQRSMDHVERQFHEWPVSRLVLLEPPDISLKEDLGRALGLPLDSLKCPSFLSQEVSCDLLAEAWLLYGMLLKERS